MEMDLSPVGVVHVGEDRRVREANIAAHGLLDAAPGRLPGRTVMETFLDARLEAALAVVDLSRAARLEPARAAFPVGGAVSAELRVGAPLAAGAPRLLAVRA